MASNTGDNTMLSKKRLIELIAKMKLPDNINAGQYITGFNDACDRILVEIQKGYLTGEKKNEKPNKSL